MALSGSEKTFEIGWNDATRAIDITPGLPYTAVGGELVPGDGQPVQAVTSTAVVYINGEKADLAAYNIRGNNYFKLRDLGAALDFGVSYDAETNTVLIDTTTGYTP